MKRPTKAIVLAAGLGTRLLPVTRQTPKALLPFRGVPMLQRSLSLLAAWGVRDVLVNMHHLAPNILDFVRTMPPCGLRISLSFEPTVLGTGGAVRRAGWFLSDEPFWLLNADVLASLSPRPLLRAFQATDPLAILWVDPERGPRSVQVSDGRVVEFATKTPAAPGTYTFCGLHLVAPRILRYLPPGASSIIAAYRHAQDLGEQVRAVNVRGAYWADIGSPESYRAAHADAPPLPGDRDLGPPDLSVPLHQAEPAVGHAARKLVWSVGKCSVSPLSVRGSARTFYRLRSGRKRAIVVRYSLERAENALYVSHARWLLRLNIPVPRVMLNMPRLKTIVLEDLGDTDLDAYVASHNNTAMLRMYRRVVDITARLHTIPRSRYIGRSFCEPFSPALCRWEHDLFIDCFLRTRMNASPACVCRLREELRRLTTRFCRLPRTLLHRDLQSSNIFIHRGRPYLIDFQGMRHGPAMYDVASLLCDPYMSLDPSAQLELLDHYCRTMGWDPVKSRADFWLASVQRLLQAIGAYGRLSALPGTQRFATHIPAALTMLERALQHVGGLDCLGERVPQWIEATTTECK